MQGKPYAGNPHVRFDEGEVALAATPRRGSLLYNMRKMMPLAALCVATTCTWSYADVSSVRLPYASTKYFMGQAGCDLSTVLTEEAKLAFPGATLDDVKALVDKGYIFGGHLSGSQVNLSNRPCQSSQILTRSDSQTGSIDLIVVSFMYAFRGKTMAASIELTNGVDGVYARIGRSQTKSSADTSFVCATLDADGHPVYTCDSSNPNGASGVAADSSGICLDSLSIVNSPNSTAPTLLWPGATLDEVKDYDFTANVCGTAYSNNSVDTVIKGYNKRVTTDETGNATSIIVEFQYKNGAIRYVIVEFTNGAGGVYAQALCSGYIDKNVPDIGAPIIKDGGGYNGTLYGTPNYGLHDGITEGYGVFAICAVPAQKAYQMSAWITRTSQKVWANSDGETVLTLDDIKEHSLFAIINGKSIGVDYVAKGYNKKFEYDETGSVKSMTVSYQINQLDIIVKYVNVMFTNGVDGVYGYATGAGYISGAPGVETPLAGNYTLSTGLNVNGYGAYNFVASPGVVQLSSDADWSNRGTIPWDGTIIDLNGHNLTVEAGWHSSVFVSPNATVVNSVAGTATLRIKTPFGNTFNNYGIKFGASSSNENEDKGKFYPGDVKFIKDGAGTYVAAVAQHHANIIEIAKGTVKAGILPTSTPLGPKSMPVVVNAGCAFDFNGYELYVDYSFVLNGGELRNTGAAKGWNKAQVSTVSLTADSSLSLDRSYGMVGGGISETNLKLDGNTLTINTASGSQAIFENTTATAGKVVAQGAGELYIGPPPSFSNQSGCNGFLGTATDVSIACALNLQHWMKVRDYTALYDGSGNSGTAVLEVYGTFKPVGTGFYAPTMQGGSAIDLTEWEGTLPPAGIKVADVDSASTVTVKLDTDSPDTKAWARTRQNLITWETAPVNVTFVLDSESERHFRLVKSDTALQLTPKPGFIIIVK